MAVTLNGNGFISNGIADWLYEGRAQAGHAPIYIVCRGDTRRVRGGVVVGERRTSRLHDLRRHERAANAISVLRCTGRVHPSDQYQLLKSRLSTATCLVECVDEINTTRSTVCVAVASGEHEVGYDNGRE